MDLRYLAIITLTLSICACFGQIPQAGISAEQARLDSLSYYQALQSLEDSDEIPFLMPVAMSLSSRNYKPVFPRRLTPTTGGLRFLQETALLDLDEREEAIYEEIARGNFPNFLKHLVPVTLTGEIFDRFGRPIIISAVIRVMPDYLGIGNNSNFVRMPMNYYTATRLARDFGMILPTDKIVDAIHEQASIRCAPHPLPPGPKMITNLQYAIHHRLIQEELGPYSLGQLVSGIKKDVVLAAKLSRRPGRIVIYGWHNSDGMPIQPLSSAHHAGYADYSHGVRFISPIVEINGHPYLLQDLLADWRSAQLFSSEGPITNAQELMNPRRQSLVKENSSSENSSHLLSLRN